MNISSRAEVHNQGLELPIFDTSMRFTLSEMKHYTTQNEPHKGTKMNFRSVFKRKMQIVFCKMYTVQNLKKKLVALYISMIMPTATLKYQTHTAVNKWLILSMTCTHSQYLLPCSACIVTRQTFNIPPQLHTLKAATSQTIATLSLHNSI